MNIAILTDGIFPYVIGGMQRHSFYLVKHLAAAGHKIDLYHCNMSEEDINALSFFEENEKQNISSFVIEFPSFGKTPGHYIRESYEYSRRVWTRFRKQKRCDFIIVKGFAGWELLNQKKNGTDPPPVGVNFHGYEMFQKPSSVIEWAKAALLLRSPVKFCVANADYLFSYGGKITGIIESLGVPRNRIIEIPTGITPDWLNDAIEPSGEVRKFLFVGRYERRKGLPELYSAISSISKTDSAEFTFIGDIPEKKQLKKSNCFYKGKIVDTTQLKEMIRKSEVLVCPSFSEGMPNVILEAMASGLAVIATDTGAVTVAVDEKSGWIIPPGDKKALAEALLAAININPQELDKKRNAAKEKVIHSFMWTDICEQTVQAIEKIISEKNSEA